MRPAESLGPNGLRETIARRFAPMARFGADAMVLVVSRVPLTLRATHATRFDAGGELRAQEIDVPFSLSRHDLSRGLTDDSAIQAERDALDALHHLGLGKRIVGARRTFLSLLVSDRSGELQVAESSGKDRHRTIGPSLMRLNAIPSS